MDGRWNGAGKGIANYLPANGPDDLKNARCAVNVTDKWELIGGYYTAFLSAIKDTGGVPVVTPAPQPAPTPTPKPAATIEPQSVSDRNWLANLIEAIASVFKRTT